MAPLHGAAGRTTDVATLPADKRFDPRTPLTLAMQPDREAPSSPRLDEVPALILSLLGRTEPSLTAMEQHVLRACLRLAGESLPLVGGLDADFYEALLAFKARHGVAPLDARLDLPTLTLVVGQAAHAVGGPDGRGWRAVRAAWFDVWHAPRLIAEAPGIVGLIRELKGGRTRAPRLAVSPPPPLPDDAPAEADAEAVAAGA